MRAPERPAPDTDPATAGSAGLQRNARLACQGQELAAHHRLARWGIDDFFAERLPGRLEQLLAAWPRATEGDPDAETLVLRQHVQRARNDTRHGFSQGLRRIRGGATYRHLRVHAITSRLVALTGAELDPLAVHAFVAGYQGSSSLEVAELRSFAAMTRIAVLEWLVRELSATEGDADRRSVAVAGLRGLAFVDHHDWDAFADDALLSTPGERVLRSERSGVYAATAVETRQPYLHAVARLSRICHVSREQVAAAAVALADAAEQGQDSDTRAAHVGDYLIGDRRDRLIRSLCLRVPRYWSMRCLLARHAATMFLGGFWGVVACIVMATLAGPWQSGASGVWLAALAPLVALSFSQTVLSGLSWLSTVATQPTRLPRLSFAAGIPAEARTAVCMPVKISHQHQLQTVCGRLERHCIDNPDAGIVYCLLLDLADAPQQHMPGDAALVERARSIFDELNARHGRGVAQPFLLLYRDRMWNQNEDAWIGWERKRGKLLMFNRLILGLDQSSMRCLAGSVRSLQGVRYVITLDADNSLPPGAARRLAGTIAHPLNRPLLEPGSNRVSQGYTILQPAIVPERQRDYDSAYRSAFDPGLDQIHGGFVFRNVNQDLFGEGEYWGKGIYDVVLFEQTAAQAVPNNRVLMHDLLEGMYARTAFVGDVRMGEVESNNVCADLARLHRWARGDWQNIGWIRSRLAHRALGPGMHDDRNPLPLISRWKLFNHLQMTLSTVAQFGLLFGAMTFLDNGVYWALLVGVALYINLMFSDLLKAGDHWSERSLGASGRRLLQQGASRVFRTFSNVLAAPALAWIYLDAATRALWRVGVSHRHLLEWVPYSELGSGTDLSAYLRLMWAGPAAALLATAIIASGTAEVSPVAWLLVPLWLLSPAITWRASAPAQRRGTAHLPANDE